MGSPSGAPLPLVFLHCTTCQGQLPLGLSHLLRRFNPLSVILYFDRVRNNASDDVVNLAPTHPHVVILGRSTSRPLPPAASYYGELRRSGQHLHLLVLNMPEPR